MGLRPEEVAEFFHYSRERYQILRNRWMGKPREEWTEDKILQTWSFCNIFREDDAVTIWFRENIRDALANNTDVLMATIAFRWFNRVETGEILRPFLVNGTEHWHWIEMRKRLMALRETGRPVITGAYMVKTPPDLNKVDGLLLCLQRAVEKEDEILHVLTQPYCTLEKAWEAIRTIPYMGDFTSYEVVTDLRHTFLLREASDIMCWANPGPGCAAGLSVMCGQDRKHYDRHSSAHRDIMMDHMRDLLTYSREEKFWPQNEAFPPWEMREVEHTLCEFDKYTRARLGLRLKRRYKRT